MDNQHEVEYSGTVEDLLYAQGAFAGIYAGANTLQNLGSAAVRPGWLLAGGHQLVPAGGSNFAIGTFGGNNLFDKAFNKTIGKTALGKGLASAEGVNFMGGNFSYYSNKAYHAAGGMQNKQALLPGINFSFKGSMKKHLNSISDFTEGTEGALKKADDAVEKATKNLFKLREGAEKAISSSYQNSLHATEVNSNVKRTSTSRLKKLKKERLAKENFDNVIKKSEVSLSSAESKLFSAKKDLLEQTSKFSREEIVEAGSKLKGTELDTFASNKAKEIVGTYSDEFLAKHVKKDGVALTIEEIEEQVGNKILQQSKNKAFASSLGGKTLSLLGRGGAKAAGVFFSAPVQVALGIETVANMASSARTNWQLNQIKEWQAGKQSVFTNPYTTAVVQKGNQIATRNNTELNALLSSSNVAKGIAARVGVN